MTRSKFEPNIRNKTLSFNGNPVKLEDNLKGGEIRHNPQNKRETHLHLDYAEKQDFSPEDEGAVIYEFMKKYDPDEKINISPAPSEVYEPENHPAVTLMGDFEAYINN